MGHEPDKVEVTINVNLAGLPKIDQILGILKQLLTGQEKLMALDQQVLDALKTIDDATTKIAGNVQVIADTDQTISDEVDSLQSQLAAALAGGTPVTQAMVDAAAALSAKAQATSDALDAQVPVLQAIAAKGVTNPVPVPVPPSPAQALKASKKNA